MNINLIFLVGLRNSHYLKPMSEEPTWPIEFIKNLKRKSRVKTLKNLNINSVKYSAYVFYQFNQNACVSNKKTISLQNFNVYGGI